MIDDNYNEFNNYNPCEYSGFVEIDSFNNRFKNKTLIKLKGSIKPERLMGADCVFYTCVYKPEYGDFFELRPVKVKEIGILKDYLEIVK
jgi:hypothetical protein